MKGKGRSGLGLVLGLLLAVAAGAWAGIGYLAVGDLRSRIIAQRSRLDEADKVRLAVLTMRRAGGARPAASGQATGDPVSFLTQTAQAAGISGTKLKGIIPLAAVPREGLVEKGYSIELAGIDRKSMIQFLVDVETLRPSYRTRELRVRRFSPEGEIAGATAVVVYLESAPAKAAGKGG
jgi:hypothetical protein